MKALAITLFSLLAIGTGTATANTFGAEMPTGSAQSIAAAITGFSESSTDAQKFSGRVAKVCRKKGCWMELESDGLSARVTMLDYGFFLPTDAHGDAEVFGTLSRVKLDEKTAAHYAKDAGIDVADVPREEFQLVAHSVVLAAP